MVTCSETLFNIISAFSNDHWLFAFFRIAMGLFIGMFLGTK